MRWFIIAVCAVLSACGGGSSSDGTAPPPKYSIGGTVSGLTGQGLTLQNNGGDDLPVSANGTVTFAAALISGSAYSVTVKTPPENPSQSCTVTNGSGTVASVNVTTIAVACVDNIAPAIGTNPSSQTVVTGSTATFSGAASGTPTPAVQWQVSTDGGASFSNVGGATATTLSVAASTGQNGNQYRAVFANVAGTATTSAATLTVTAVVPTPAISSLAPNSIIAGSAGFTLTVNGSNFTSTGLVTFAGTPLVTTFVNSSQLTAVVPTSAVTGAQAVPVTVAEGALTSLPATFQVTANPFPAVLSQSFSNPGAFGDRPSSLAAADAQGRFIAYQSQASNLISGYAGNGGLFDIYLRDTCVAAPTGCIPTTTLISVDPSGAQCSIAGGVGSTFASISGDGRFVAFTTDDCFPGSTAANRQVALRDTCNSVSGPVSVCTPSTTLISVNTSGQISTGESSGATISRNGRYVVWPSIASDLVPGVTSNSFSQVYLRDTCNSSSGAVAGCTPRTIAVTSDADWHSGVGRFPAVSNNGIVVFDSPADNIIHNPAFLPCCSTTTVFRADCSGSGNQCSGYSVVTIVPGSGDSSTGTIIDSAGQTISPDGRFIAFTSRGEDTGGNTLVPQSQLPPNFPSYHVQMPPLSAMVFDSCVDAGGTVAGCTPSFAYASVDNGGNLDLTLNDRSGLPSLSDDGRFVSFPGSLNLSASYPGGGTSAYVRDTCKGSNPPANCTPSTVLVSVDGLGVAAGSVDIVSRISGDGHFVVFDSLAQFPTNTSTALPINQVVMVRTTF